MSTSVVEGPSPPKAAATVIVVRPGRHGFEVLLVRRHSGLAFMGGAHVFPGGKVDSRDAELALLRELDEAARNHLARLLGPSREPLRLLDALALHIAACRELFEEAGVLLAEPRGDLPSVEVLAAWRAQLGTEKMGLAELLRTRRMWPAVTKLCYWSHWLTPSVEARRYDTRFFLAELPEGAVARADLGESTELTWLTPAKAVAAAAKGELLLPPPTLYTLLELGAFASLSELWRAIESRQIATILPKLVLGESPAVLLPWDRDYQAAEGEAVAWYGPPGKPGSRLVLSDGRWVCSSVNRLEVSGGADRIRTGE